MLYLCAISFEVVNTLLNSTASASQFHLFVLWTDVIAPAKAGAPVQKLNFISMKSVVKKNVHTIHPLTKGRGVSLRCGKKVEGMQAKKSP